MKIIYIRFAIIRILLVPQNMVPKTTIRESFRCDRPTQ